MIPHPRVMEYCIELEVDTTLRVKANRIFSFNKCSRLGAYFERDGKFVYLMLAISVMLNLDDTRLKCGLP